MQLRTYGTSRISRETVLGGRRHFKIGPPARRRLRPIALVAAAVALLGTAMLAAPAAAQGVVGTVPGRVGGSMAALVALVGVVVGGLALSRARRDRTTAAGAVTGSGHDAAIVALVLGLVGVVLAVVHLATSTGAVGTGSGKAGAMVAAVLGVIGVLLGRQALSRSGSTG
jgi:hypothetical protein